MKKEKIKDVYGKLRPKLPTYALINKDFEISRISEVNKDFVLRDIRRKMNEKVIFFCRVIEGLLFPTQPNAISMHEGKFFDEDERKKLLDAYKNLMRYERESVRLDVEGNERDEAGYINNLAKNWMEYKKYMKEVTKTMKDAWSKEENIVINNYVG